MKLTDVRQLSRTEKIKRGIDRAYIWLFGFDYSDKCSSFRWKSEFVMMLTSWRHRITARWYCFKLDIIILPYRICKSNSFGKWYERTIAQPYLDNLNNQS